MNADIITIGDEILIGQINNTNSTWLASRITEAGFRVANIITIGDDIEAITTAVKVSAASNALTVVTGGLGPTHDDVTRDGVANAFGKELIFDEAVYRKIEARFERRGRKIPESNKVQAMVPEDFVVLDNEMGSAPGLWYTSSQGDNKNVVVVVPGVPREMKWLFTNQVLPRLRKAVELPPIAYRTLSLTGIGESNLQDLVRPTLDRFPSDVSVAFLPNLDGVRIRLGLYDYDVQGATEQLDKCERLLREITDRFIYTRDDIQLENVLYNLLRDNEMTLAIAESCTGGLISSRLTDVPGASAVFKGAVVAYSNDVKRNTLGVDDEILAAHGAVSEPAAVRMAEEIRNRFHTDIGLSTSGIMGPTGGSDEKPVGTVWFGFASAEGSFAVKQIFGNDRIGNKRRSSTAGMNLVRLQLLKMRQRASVS